MCTGTDEPASTNVGGSYATILRLDVPASDTFGGKGRSLANLIGNDHPVPCTGVVTTPAYRSVARESGLASFIASVASGAEVTEEVVDAQFASAPLPLDVEREIVETASEVGNGGPIAVRSSATVEDLQGSSFAGQYRSLLNIDSTDASAVIDAVRSVWASLWHPAPTAYRRAFGIDESNVAMAVVLMRMVPATSAGVVFTVDPGGAPDSARIEAVDGLGEALVSGQETPEAWVVPRIASAKIGNEGLPPVPTRALELALAIEDSTGLPQDVEWAALGDDVVVVQARPITVLDTHDGFDTAVDDHELTTAGIIEMVPGVLGPLRWDLNSLLLEEAFRSVLDSLGILQGTEAERRPFIRRVRGRAALDFDQLRAAASGVPGAAEELEVQYFGTPRSSDVEAHGRRGFASMMGDLRTLRTRRHVVEAAEILINTVEGLRHTTPTLTSMTDEELLAYSRRMIDLAARGLAAELGVAASGAASYQRVEQLLIRHLGREDAGPALQSVIITSSDRTERPDHASAAIFAGETWAELGGSPPRPPALEEGEREARLKDLEHRLTSLPGWKRRRILTGQVVDVRIHLIRRTVNETVEQVERRERTKAAILESGGEVRRVQHELGQRLCNIGALATATDVELLTTGEIAHACTDPQSTPGQDVLRRRRNWLSRYEAEGQLPIRFTGTPDRTPTPLPDGDVLSGWAASPGRYRGSAQVVSSARGAFDDGAVLVAEATDASWSPMFVRAGAVVVERGGPLSHAAILARELGLPAVLNVEGATSLLDGTTVSVDGDQGLVVIERSNTEVSP